MSCQISYIPRRLHSEDKPEIPTFRLGELIYRRCRDIDNPFDEIKLWDVSCNRQGTVENPICEIDDVLYNLEPDNGKGERLNEDIVVLEIKELSGNNTYEKTFEEEGLDGNGNMITNSCLMKLLHDRLSCNYSHCIFQCTFNGIIVTNENYKITIGRKGTSISQLRTTCKLALAEMIIRKEIRINN